MSNAGFENIPFLSTTPAKSCSDWVFILNYCLNIFIENCKLIIED
jgi:hypothetical protein